MATNRPSLRALDARPGPAVPVSEARAREMVDGALDRALARGTPRRVRPAMKVALALAATLVVGVAGAATVRIWSQRTPAPKILEAPTVAPDDTSTRPRPGGALVAPQPSAVEEVPPVAPDLPAPTSTAQEGASQGRMALAPPEDLLRQANDLRAARRWRDAAHAYERVVGAHPGSPEAYAAAVAAADLHLEQMGDPGGALRLYRAALQRNPRGPLSDPILWGIARCRRAVGDTDGERAALGDYLSRFPGGLFAPTARQRLDALKGSAP